MTMHQLLDRASYFADHLQEDVPQTLKGQTIVNLFFEIQQEQEFLLN